MGSTAIKAACRTLMKITPDFAISLYGCMTYMSDVISNSLSIDIKWDKNVASLIGFTLFDAKVLLHKNVRVLLIQDDHNSFFAHHSLQMCCIKILF